jgi:UDP-glucose 4-epimerase
MNILVTGARGKVGAATTADLTGHETVYCAAADNAAGRPLHDMVRHHFGDEVELRPVGRPDASGISTAGGSGVQRGLTAIS